MTIAQQTLRKHKIITTRGESEKKKKQMFHVLVFPPEKIKNEKSVTTNKRIHPKKNVSAVIYFSFIHSMYVVVTVYLAPVSYLIMKKSPAF